MGHEQVVRVYAAIRYLTFCRASLGIAMVASTLRSNHYYEVKVWLIKNMIISSVDFWLRAGL